MEASQGIQQANQANTALFGSSIGFLGQIGSMIGGWIQGPPRSIETSVTYSNEYAAGQQALAAKKQSETIMKIVYISGFLIVIALVVWLVSRTVKG